jgi:Holliday junction resolvase RusA-like endonuclease
MNFTHSILKQMGYKLDPDGNYSRTETNTPRVSDAKPKPVARKTLQNTNKAQERSKERIVLRVTRYATRLLDEDNLAGAKLLVDQLRYAGIIPNDDPQCLKIILDQIKVKHKTEERTEIEIKEL